jgi:hypothetical protein
MSGFGDDDVAEVSTSGAAETVSARSERSQRSLAMFDNIRATMYVTMSGLMYAGIEMEQAAELLAEEYRGEGMEDAAASVSTFFGAVATALNSETGDNAKKMIGTAAWRAFGMKFVGPEEMALLKALTVSNSPDRILRACADVINQVQGERVVGSPSSFRRFAS